MRKHNEFTCTHLSVTNSNSTSHMQCQWLWGSQLKKGAKSISYRCTWCFEGRFQSFQACSRTLECYLRNINIRYRQHKLAREIKRVQGICLPVTPLHSNASKVVSDLQLASTEMSPANHSRVQCQWLWGSQQKKGAESISYRCTWCFEGW